MSGLGDALVAQGVLTPDQLHEAEQRRHEYGGSLAKTLIQLQLADERSLLRGLASTMGMDYLDVDARSVDASAAALVPAELLEQLQALPVGFSDGDELLVAISDPNRRDVAERIGQLTGLPVRLGLASRTALAEAIAQHAANAGTGTATNGRVAPSVDAAATGTGSTDGVPAPDEATVDGLPIAPEASPPAGRPAGADDLPLRVESEEPAIDIDDLLVALFERGGSDLHLTVGTPPTIRINGDLTRLEEFPALDPGELRKMIYSIMTSKQREVFENSLELDMSYSVPGLARFRVNVFQQRDSLGAVMRIIPFEILPLEDLGIPSQVAEFASLPRGFVLVTGPTGSGKSTTLASIIDMINRTRPVHIMTVEDPIEFLHDHKTAVVNQREVGTDTHGFADALKHALRQDPDVILVGELRDLETIQIALTAAETGHLVFGTLHTQDAPQTVDRIIDVFPPHQQEQIRVMLAGALQGVVCQTLLKRVDGEGRIAACEVMVTTSGIKNLIREGKTHQIYSSMQSGGQHGMLTMDQSLANLVRRGLVTRDAALEKAADIQEFERLASGA